MATLAEAKERDMLQKKKKVSFNFMFQGMKLLKN